MTVGDEDAIEAAKSDSGSEDLALGAFAAVDQEAMVAEAHHL